MKTSFLWSCGLVCLGLTHGAVQAIYVAGALPNARPGGPRPVVALPTVQRGAITAIRPDARQIGTQVEIGGRWLLVLDGRTMIRRAGLPVSVDALQVGQTVGFSMATAMAGETALETVYVP